MKKTPLLLVLSSCLTLFSQEQNKPKVGLVLSGGGAKGFAHRGLKVLEVLKIDYIGEQVWVCCWGVVCIRIQLKLILFFNRQILMNK
jgi:hypothetical protein